MRNLEVIYTLLYLKGCELIFSFLRTFKQAEASKRMMKIFFLILSTKVQVTHVCQNSTVDTCFGGEAYLST